MLVAVSGLAAAQDGPITPSASGSTSELDPITGLPLGALISMRSTKSGVAPLSTDWIKYQGNPVLDRGVPGSWDSGDVSTGCVLLKDERYMMWYTGGTSSLSSLRIGLATSEDGVNWVKSASNPVLTVSPDSWDRGYVICPHVIFHDGMYKMWYRGIKDAGKNNTGASIGYATSADGEHWVKYPGNPVLTLGPSADWDSRVLMTAHVLVEGDTYKMWYSGCGATRCRIGYATSPDGVNWTRYVHNPVLETGPTGSWDSKFAYYPSIYFNGSFYEMWYSGYDKSVMQIGYATSTDGINWIKYAGNPILGPGPAGSWESQHVAAPSVLLHAGAYRMWYSGERNRGDRVGYALSIVGLRPRSYIPLLAQDDTP
jgi:predicted GH43/DUF377 family glycosyl hydrolase